MDPNLQRVLGAQDNNARTILDYLNEDCWQAVLNYVPTKDLLRTESTSKCWQSVVLGYLSRKRIDVVLSGNRKNDWQLVMKDTHYSSFKCWTDKLGFAVVTFEKSRDSDDGLETVWKNCPNLEVIKLVSLMNLPTNNTEESFHHLKQICIETCYDLTDDCVSQFLSSHALEELTIKNGIVTGQCLNNLKSSKLKSLALRSCRRLTVSPLLSLADRLGNLTKLVLTRIEKKIRDSLHLVIDKLPKLEYVTVVCYHKYTHEQEDIIFESLCRLKNLKELRSDFRAYDKHVEAVARCCKQLRVLKTTVTGVTGHGVEAVCRDVGARLTAFDLSCSKVTANDVVSLVYACPNLTWLRANYCILDGAELGQRVASARREMRAETRLQLTIEGDWDSDFEMNEKFEDVLEIGIPDDILDCRYISGPETDTSDSD